MTKAVTHCAVADCENRTAPLSVLCRGHQERYYAWRKKVDLSKIPGESSCDYWLQHPNEPAPKGPLKPGQIAAVVIGLKIEEEKSFETEWPVLSKYSPDELACLVVRVKPTLHFDDYLGRVIFDEDEEGPAKYQALSGWYCSLEEAQAEIDSLRRGVP